MVLEHTDILLESVVVDIEVEVGLEAEINIYNQSNFERARSKVVLFIKAWESFWADKECFGERWDKEAIYWLVENNTRQGQALF